MEILQIIILIVGAILFTVSFFIPDRQVNTKEIREKEEKIFRELMEKEFPDIQKRIDEATQEGIEHAKENTQRQMERLTNEKMMAINEYSDTVMSEIHKNHEEAVFLYDMLNNKHAQVKDTATELMQVIKQSKQVQTTTRNTRVKGDKKTAEMADKRSGDKIGEDSLVEKNIVVDAGSTFEAITSDNLEVVIPPVSPEMDTTVEMAETEASGKNSVEIMFATEGNEENSNERILELHKAGKSNMAIARELGLGIGEVKLVIDLFKGGL